MAEFKLPNIVNGQSVTVQANSLGEAQQKAAAATGVSLAAQQGGGTFGINTNPNVGGSSGGSPGTTVSSSSSTSGAGLDALLQAAQRGDKETFEKTLNEQIREFDQKYGLDLKQFTEAIRQYNQNFGITEAGLTGTYQGAPTMAMQSQNAQLYGMNGAPAAGQQTLANLLQQANITAQKAQTAQQWAAQYGFVPTFDAAGNPYGPDGQPLPTLQAQNQAYTQQLGLVTTAAGLQANPFRQAQALGQMGGLLGGGGVASFAAPNTVAGVGTQGGNTRGGMGYLEQMIQDIRDPTANATSMNQVLQGIPTPNKLNSTEFLRAAPSTQSMVLQGMQEKFGIDPNDALAQIKATLPQFTAPTTVGAVKR